MSKPTFESIKNEALEKLSSAIIESRKNSKFTVDMKSTSSPVSDAGDELSECLDAYISGNGFNGIGDAWIEVDPITAKRIMEHGLSKGLAYGSILMEKEDAAAFSDKFLALFGEGARLFTNGDCVVGSVTTIDGKTVPGFKAISKCTLDTGIVAVDSKHIGMLWAWDED